MTNDAPFQDLPIPPRSATQPAAEADLRGTDYGSSPADDEYARAIAYKQRIIDISRNKITTILGALKGNKEAARSLQHKTLPLTQSAPPYLDSP